ncbi:ELWxxDGT repeat protein [Corallococcus sp. CA053C]|uniref:ELWxxDGT repeat protein n=1 Tax=Corallococcus sp. CA053C TaxID=2316732 RepID=UPI001F1A6A4B|nr:ELWxxDGT repeat protein [Corallococcus sp. CA053C]
MASRVKVVMTPGLGEFVGELTNVQGTLYFVTTTYDTEAILWRSDGTEAGTVQVKVFSSTPGGFSLPTDLVAVGNRLFFQVYSAATGNELWTSDGTAAGTRMVEDITPGAGSSSLSNPTDVNGRLVFFRRVPVPGGAEQLELWRSDGTATGTLRVRNFRGFSGLSYDTLKVGNALLFFFSQDTGTTLWRTDGTLAGTTSLKQLDAEPVIITQVNRTGDPGVFILKDGPNHEVWKTNGTAAGTFRLDAFGKPVGLLGTLGTSVYLESMENTTTKRLRIDRLSLNGGGKTFITTLPNPYGAGEDAYPFVQHVALSGSDLYFSLAIGSSGPAPVNVALWATNGTAAGTRKLDDTLFQGDQYWSPVFATGTGQVLFSANPVYGGPVPPYFTRGSVATTGKLADVSGPDSFTRAGNRIFFTAYDDTHLRQLWSVPASFSCPPGLTEARE